MRRYRIPDEHIRANVKRQLPLLYGAVTILVITVIIQIFSYATSADKSFPLLLVSLLFLGYLILVFLRYASRSRNVGQSFELEIDETRLVYRKGGIEDRVINKQEIASIELTSPRGSLIIKTDSLRKQIRVPYFLDGFDEVVQRLGEWGEIQEVSLKKFHSQLILIISSLSIISVLLSSGSLDNQIAIPMIFFICSSSVGMLCLYQVSPDEFDKDVRRLSWLLLAPVIILLARIIAWIA